MYTCCSVLQCILIVSPDCSKERYYRMKLHLNKPQHTAGEPVIYIFICTYTYKHLYIIYIYIYIYVPLSINSAWAQSYVKILWKYNVIEPLMQHSAIALPLVFTTTWYESHVNTHCHGTPAATHCNTMRLVALLLERGKQDHIFNPLVLDCMLVSCLSLNMDIYMNIYIYIHGYIQHKGIHIYTICTYIRTHVYACIYIRLCVHECVCAHTYKLRYTSKP